jgi:hypothetical protein
MSELLCQAALRWPSFSSSSLSVVLLAGAADAVDGAATNTCLAQQTGERRATPDRGTDRLDQPRLTDGPGLQTGATVARRTRSSRGGSFAATLAARRARATSGGRRGPPPSGGRRRDPRAGCRNASAGSAARPGLCPAPVALPLFGHPGRRASSGAGISCSPREGGDRQRSGGLREQHPLGALIDALGLRRAVTDSGQTGSTMLCQAADPVEHHAALPGLVEVQFVPGDDVEEIVERERAPRRRLEVVGGDEVFLPTSRREEAARGPVIAPVGQELQGEKAMGGPGPLRRLISMAYVLHPPAPSWTTTKSSVGRCRDAAIT